MKLTRNFWLIEFTRSDTAERYGLDNTPTPEHLANLHTTALGFEQARRLLSNRVIHVRSGYRSAAVNAKVGGTETSAHCLGYAGDIDVEGLGALEVARFLESKLAFDQLIYEPSRKIVHLSFDPRLRQEVKTQKGGPGSPIVWGIAI